MKQNGLWNNAKGENALDSGAPFYETYKTKDGKYIAVGAIEPQFYTILLNKLDLKDLPDQLDMMEWPKLKSIFAKKFLEKTRREWEIIFDGTDACVTPILEIGEKNIGSDIMLNKHNKDRNFLSKSEDADDMFEPLPAPRLSRTPSKFFEGSKKVTAAEFTRQPKVGEDTFSIFLSFGISKSECDALSEEGAIFDSSLSLDSKL
ncbi:hypothetical protein HDU92_008842 [Lobulomyces angularis]|nr:hypothetical protein HDU92_008842 [Lobulomyces angularis]